MKAALGLLLLSVAAGAVETGRSAPIRLQLPAVAASLPAINVIGAPTAIPALNVQVPDTARPVMAPMGQPENPGARAQAERMSAPQKEPVKTSMTEPTSESNWKGQINALLYPVMFSENPVQEVDRALDSLLDVPNPIWTREGFQKAIAIALSQKKLSKVVGEGDHPEATIRAYLTAVQEKLKTRRGA